LNGGFETGDFTSWTTDIRSATSVAPGPRPPHSGTYAAQLGAVTSDDRFWQDVPTTPNGSYHIDFWYLSDGAQPADLHVFWDGVEIYSEINSAAHGYEEHAFDLPATSSTTRLEFDARNDPGYDALDDVSVTPLDGAALPGRGGLLHAARPDAAAALPGGSTRTTPVTAPSATSPALPLPSDRPVATAAAAVRQDTASTDAFFANIQRSDSLLAPAVSVGDSFAPADSSRLALWAPEAI